MNKINAQKTKDMVIIGLMAAIICVMGPLSIRLPFTLVPISLTNLAIYFILYVAGTRRTVISYLIYLLIGMCGVPVFSNFSSGVQKLAGPTGGYLVGFIFMAMVSGFFIDRWYNKPVIAFAGMWLGKAVSAAFGTIWYAYVAGLSFSRNCFGYIRKGTKVLPERIRLSSLWTAPGSVSRPVPNCGGWSVLPNRSFPVSRGFRVTH